MEALRKYAYTNLNKEQPSKLTILVMLAYFAILLIRHKEVTMSNEAIDQTKNQEQGKQGKLSAAKDKVKGLVTTDRLINSGIVSGIAMAVAGYVMIHTSPGYTAVALFSLGLALAGVSTHKALKFNFGKGIFAVVQA
jgi:hypothetical protein